MTGPEATCPNCGARVEFRWSSAVQTVCPFCRSILVRQDVDLKKVGTVADLPPSSSPIQLGTAGRYHQKAFEVVGRIVYEWEQGGWNEWHVVFNDSTSGWLSDAQAEYAVSFLAADSLARPERDAGRRTHPRLERLEDLEARILRIEHRVAVAAHHGDRQVPGAHGERRAALGAGQRPDEGLYHPSN